MNNFIIKNKVNDSIIKEMIELDKLVFSGNDVGSFNRCKEWVKTNPDIYTVLIQNSHVIGYINFMPITDYAYNKVKQGKLKDTELTKKDIVKFKPNMAQNCLFASIVIKPEFQDTSAIIELWAGLKNKLKALSVVISNVIIDCVSEDGKKFVKKNFNAKIIASNQNRTLYEGNIKEL